MNRFIQAFILSHFFRAIRHKPLSFRVNGSSRHGHRSFDFRRGGQLVILFPPERLHGEWR
jgi:hypothetical protein